MSVLICAGALALEVRVRGERRDGLLGDGRDVTGLDEDQQRGFGVAPGGLAEQLVDGLGELLRAVPELAFGDEHVAVLDADQDVGLAGAVEHLPAARPSSWALRPTSSRSRMPQLLTAPGVGESSGGKYTNSRPGRGPLIPARETCGF